jgi:hypothetical protein
VSSYELVGAISDQEAEEMRELAITLRGLIENWISEAHPELKAPNRGTHYPDGA